MFLQHDAEGGEKEEREAPDDKGVKMPGMLRSPETALRQEIDHDRQDAVERVIKPIL
jgi:hypothetical protein